MSSDAIIGDAICKGVELGMLPRYLYKYKAIDSTLKDVIIKGSLWFSNPQHFNDPFDCQITIETENSQSEIEHFIKTNVKSPLPPSQIVGSARKMLRDPKKWNDSVNRAVKGHINSTGICCFSGNEDNILLWSHYANCHKGVCLKFDILKDPEFFITPLKVKYEVDYPQYNHLRDYPRLIELLFQTKAKLWSYEEEIRILKFSTGLHNFQKKALVEVIFGCKAIHSDVFEVKALFLNNGYSETQFKQAVVKASQYGLEILDV